MKWWKRPPLPLVIIAVVLALWPIFPSPYLVVKLNELLKGEAIGMIDVLRLLLHGGGLIFLMMLCWQMMRQSQRRR